MDATSDGATATVPCVPLATASACQPGLRTLTRLSIVDDLAGYLALAERDLAEARPDLEFDADVALSTFRSAMRTAEPLVVVVEAHDRSLVGLLIASRRPYPTAGANRVGLEVLYVDPSFRLTTAGEDLLDEFHRWASRLNVAEVSVDDPACRRGPLRRLLTTMRRGVGRRLRALKV